MTKKTITINYTEYKSAAAMEPKDRELVEAALEARSGSYAPYSKFHVGAALRLVDGTIVKGANQENVAYPSGLCAERTAMFAAGANYPGVAFDTLAIVGANGDEVCEMPAAPCGGCRQVMAEYQRHFGRPLRVILIGTHAIYKFGKVEDLLPLIFDSLKVE
ncbi:MAG: cytidine deaminase [Bacteroidales bacterium]|nr:cytidine deaminase [Bacteroidales bacterium]